MLIIELPWPPRELSPNARVHWTTKAEATQIAEAQGCCLTWGADFDDWQPSDFYMSHYTFHPPDRRKRDIDNFTAMMKPFQDGVFSALGVDDSRIKKAVQEWGDVFKGGKVVLRLEKFDNYAGRN